MSAPASPMELWKQFSLQLPADIPDIAWDAQRENFYKSHVRPWAMKQGYVDEVAKRAFFELSERPGKAAFPKTELALKSGVQTLLEPVAGLLKSAESDTTIGKVVGALGAVAQKGLQDWTAEAKAEAERQGEGTTIPEMAGFAAGSLPYFFPALRGAKLVGGAVGASEAAVNTMAFGAMEAAMESAKADNGQRFIKGMEGLAEGLAVGAVFEFGVMNPLRRLAGHGPKVSDAANKAINGVATPEEQSIAEMAASFDTSLPETATQAAVASAKVAASIGVPKAPPSVTNARGSMLEFTARDGKRYQAPAEKINEVLSSGGSLDDIIGDAKEIHKALKTAERKAVKEKKITLPTDPSPTNGKAMSISLDDAEVAVAAKEAPKIEFSSDPVTRRLQEQILDPKIGEETKEAYRDVIRMREPEALSRFEGSVAETKIVDDSALMGRLSKGSIKGEVSIDTLQRKLGLGYVEALDLLEQGREAGVLALAKEGEQNIYRLGVKKIQLADIPEYDLVKQTPEGKFARIDSGEVFDDLPSALGAKYAAKGGGSRRGFLGRMLGGAATAATGGLEKAVTLSQAGRDDIAAEVLKEVAGGAFSIKEVIPRGGGFFRVVFDESEGLDPITRHIKSFGFITDESENAMIDAILDMKGASKQTQGEILKELLGHVKAGRISLREIPEVEKLLPGDFLRKATAAEERLLEGARARDRKLLERRVEQRLRPTGMELQRTHAPLGETGEGGVLMRFARKTTTTELDAKLEAIINRIKRKYPDVARDIFGTRDPEVLAAQGRDAAGRFAKQPPSELEQQLRASLEKLGVKPKLSTSEEMTQRLLEQEAPAATPDQLSRVPKGLFLREAKEMYPEMTAEELSHFYDWQLKKHNIAYKERPLYESIPPGELSSTVIPEGATAGQLGDRVYFREQPTRGVIHHETMHVLVNKLHLPGYLRMIAGDDMGKALTNAFGEGAANLYKKFNPASVYEEVFVHLSQAYRSKDYEMLGRFIAADGSAEEVASWFVQKSEQLLEFMMNRPDSLAKRVATRKLEDGIRRSAGTLDDMERATAPFGDAVDYINGEFVVEDLAGTRHTFKDRNALADFLSDRYDAPLNAPELLDLTGLPEDLPNLAAKLKGPGMGAPVTTTPYSTPTTPIRSTSALLTFPFRPFYEWVDSLATSTGWGDLSRSMRAIEKADLDTRNFMRGYANVLKNTLGSFDKNRQRDLLKFIEAEPAQRTKVAADLNLTQKEIDALTRFNQEFVNPLEGEFSGISLEHFLRKYQGKKRWDLEELSSKQLPRAHQGELSFLGDAYRTGELDPRDQNLFRIASEYLRLGSRKRFMELPLQEAGKLVNAVDESGNFIAGNLQPLLARHINYMRGSPDYGARILYEGMDAAMGSINEGIEKVNKGLPKDWQLDKFEDPREMMNKWVSYSYAGALMARPMVPIRDGFQYFLTTFPILGAKYSARGFSRLMEIARTRGKAGSLDFDAYRIPEKYGALIPERGLIEYEAGAEVQLNKFVERGMKVLQWSNNSNRLAAFWGHAERIQDSLKGLGKDVTFEDFAEKSGISYLNKLRRGEYMSELHTLTPEHYDDFAYRAAKELVEVSQWNYSRGATPGIYKYALGKLFGQYGTWPLNYIEYARRIAMEGSPRQRVQTLSRLALAHYSILKSGDALGIDTAQWVFTQPMAYGGGPMFNAAINIPGTMDFETYRGSEARRAVVRPFWPLAIPGGLAAERILEAVAKDDPELWKIILGFHPMERGEEDEGYHLLPPRAEP